MRLPLRPVPKEEIEQTNTLLERVKDRCFEAMRIGPACRVLDVGCGSGVDTVELAQIVGGGGHVVGVDGDAALVEKANARAHDSGVAPWVIHQVEDARKLPFEDDIFDARLSARVFEHMQKPEQALEEMVRVTRPGGWVVVVDTDWGSFSTDTAEVGTFLRFARFRAEYVLANGYSGRRLRGLFHEQGLEKVKVEAFGQVSTSFAFMRQITGWDRVEEKALAMGAIKKEDLDRLYADLEKRDREGKFFSSLTLVLASGHKRI